MSLSSLTSAVIGLELCNIILLSLLLATPAPKHSMVKALMVACLLRSILDVLPPIVQKARPDEFQPHMLNGQTTLVSFCVSDSVLLRYVTVVKAAFAVSFTLPALWLAIIQIRPKCSADDYPRLTRRTVLLLCIGPFVWALPVLLVPIPHLIQGTNLWVSYNINSCYFVDNAFTIVSLVFTFVPLALAVIISGSVIFVISRWSKTTPSHHRLQCNKRSARFAALVLVTVISASFYIVVLALWISGHNQWSSTWPFQLSVMWEAVTPFLFFIIFAAQDEIYETWLGWLSRAVRCPRREHDRYLQNSPGMSQYVTYDSYISPSDHPTYSRVPHDIEATPRSPPPTFPGKIIPRPMSFKFSRNSRYTDRRHYQGASLSAPGVDGLSPPPRRKHSRTQAVEEPSKMSKFRLPLVHSPSLTTFGSQPSVFTQPNSSSIGELSASREDCGVLTTTQGSHEGAGWDRARSDTPMSTRTFGHQHAASRS
ncbi:hypothetical protein BV20DRAFT_957315 [Pilatotrama ljubarskyi]|nr:hypothetical protein BV20DRAFT_957315 [Pilatotrama ljubarskyi]